MLGDGDELDAGGLDVKALYTPGHAAGHLAFLIDGSDVFTADVLFKGTVGGTMAPGASGFADLKASVLRLLELPPETTVHPGHKEPTTIGEEWAEQPLRADLARPRRDRRGGGDGLGTAGDAEALGARLRRRQQGLGRLRRLRRRRDRRRLPGRARLAPRLAWPAGSSFVEMLVGRGAARIRRLFKEARKSGRAVIFIDELDAVGGARSGGGGDGGSNEREQALNQLLVELDGFGKEPRKVILIAASNYVEKLDKALLRPGRFDRQVAGGAALPRRPRAINHAQEAHRRALLAANRETPDDLAAHALEHETLTREDLDEIFASHTLRGLVSQRGSGAAMVAMSRSERADA